MHSNGIEEALIVKFKAKEIAKEYLPQNPSVDL